MSIYEILSLLIAFLSNIVYIIIEIIKIRKSFKNTKK